MSTEENQFGKFLKAQRKLQNITLVQLSEGLLSVSMLSKIERGERVCGKVLQDRLLNRLGESSCEYETYVVRKDYRRWQLQDTILDMIDFGCIKRIEQLLEEYKEIYAEDNKITKQFALIVQVNLMELKGENAENCFLVLQEALKLIIPIEEKKEISDFILSIDELNLILEYVTYQKQIDLKERYLEILRYLETRNFDKESRIKLYPKIVYYLCRYMNEQRKVCTSKKKARQMAEEVETISYQAIELLKSEKKLYFALELLQEQLDALDYLLSEEIILSSIKQKRYTKKQQQAREFLEAINIMYETYEIPKRTNSYTYFYREYNVYCINSVLRERRKMLQWKRKNFSDICALKTITRMEHEEHDMQKRTEERLLEKCHLPISSWHSYVVTGDRDVLCLERQFRTAISERNYKEAKKLLSYFKKNISMEIEMNHQYISYMEEVYIPYEEKKISKELYVQKAIEKLEYTIPLKVALKSIKEKKLSNGILKKGEKYLTNIEVMILYHIAYVLKEQKEGEIYCDILVEYFEKLMQEKKIIPLVGMIMNLLNEKEEDSFLQLKHDILKRQLRLRNMEYIKIKENINL